MRRYLALTALATTALLSGCAAASADAGDVVDTKTPAPTAEALDEAEAVAACRAAIIDSIDSYASTYSSPDEVLDHDYDMTDYEVTAIDGGWKLSFMPRPNRDLPWSIPCEYVDGEATADWDWESRETI